MDGGGIDSDDGTANGEVGNGIESDGFSLRKNSLQGESLQAEIPGKAGPVAQAV